MGIFEELAEEFGIGPDSPAALLAQDLAEADEEFLRQLVGLRRAAGLTQEALGRAWGRHKTAVSQFERPGADPRLSTIRRYAASIGARYVHFVTLDAGRAHRYLPSADLRELLEHWGSDEAPTPQELTGPIVLWDLTRDAGVGMTSGHPKHLTTGHRRAHEPRQVTGPNERD